MRIALAFMVASLPALSEPYVVVQGGPEGTVRANLFAERDASLAVAQVEDLPVTLGEFSAALSAAHEGHTSEQAGGKDFHPVLDRLIGARLIALEAHEMGIDELPELKAAVDQYAARELRHAMLRTLLSEVKPAPARVDRLYRDAVREWKLDSLLFVKEADARSFLAQVKAGKPFDAPASGKRSAGDFVPEAKLLPQVAAGVHQLFEGQVSDPVQVEGGYALVRVSGIRYPENAAAREEAEARAADEIREVSMQKVWPPLLARHGRVDWKLYRSLDFEAAKPGFSALEKDERVLARLRNGHTIRVADLARDIRKGLFHGIEDAVRQKRVNELKQRTFENLLRGEVLAAEAQRQKLASKPAYVQAVAEYRESLVFGEFVRRTILPGIRVSEQEGKDYYARHAGEFALPAFYALDSLAFADAKAAQRASDQLRSGSDWKWLRANAAGQLAADKRNLDLTGGTVSATALPSALTARLEGARPGDVRLFENAGQHHLILVRSAAGRSTRAYPEVRAQIAKKLNGEKVNAALKAFVEKLRKAHDVRVYLQQIGT
jgi:hypothetical protein